MVCVADRSFVVSDSPDNVSSPYYLRLPRPSLDDLIISYKIWSNLCPRSTAYVQIPKLAEFYPENCFTRNNAFSRTSQSPFHTLVGDLQQHQTQGYLCHSWLAKGCFAGSVLQNRSFLTFVFVFHFEQHWQSTDELFNGLSFLREASSISIRDLFTLVNPSVGYPKHLWMIHP
ncbi:unnamed protein product (mitochondrion) [Arabidopsis thaliana]|uniref:(thale cress) hypothetical protein n=1 Tax=Arabidopsis thaliana TaxID=3702 RepID=A0A7G2FNH7_ARATH|nr:unnamed protein product [Arabidopsis thaliana]